MVDASERRGRHGSDVVLINYDSVRQIILSLFGNGIFFGKMTYASEAAFLNVRTKRGAVPGSDRSAASRRTRLFSLRFRVTTRARG